MTLYNKEGLYKKEDTEKTYYILLIRKLKLELGFEASTKELDLEKLKYAVYLKSITKKRFSKC